ncbi:hypothetical protein CIK05_02205 [Bdellovibrio sp. qaytius]|nr:hypothetical protein CIK05_02205 [Bdellovibrio sp. qaytius]
MKIFFVLLTLVISQFTFASPPLTRWSDTVYGTPSSPRFPWASGWTHIVPFQNPNETTPSYFIYNKNTGDVQFNRVINNGGSFVNPFTTRWGARWSSFTTFEMNKNVYLLAYNSTTGDVHIDRLLPNSAGIEILWMAKWGTGWTSVNSFTVNGRPAIFVYNAASGLVNFEWINSNLQGTEHVRSITWGAGWSSFTTYTNDQGKNWYMAAYNASNGLFHIDLMNSNLNGVSGVIEKTIAKNLVISVGQKYDEAVPANRIAEIIAYTPTTGDVQVWEHSSTATFSTVTRSMWEKNLTHIIPFYIYTTTPFDGVLLTYSNTHGSSQFHRLNNRSQMACFNVGNNCEFKNTPLLNQLDPTIPEDPYKDAKTWGCYDTAIMMTSVSAMLNQSKQAGPQVNTRSDELLKVVNRNGINSKFITQYEYDAAMAGKVFYFSEVLANYANGKAVEALPAKCDLYKYGSCTSGASEYGDFSRTWATGDSLLTSTGIIRGIESGARYIFAFNWSENTVLPSGKKSVKATTSPHKVSIIGFDKKSFYPLTVNDPADGTRKHARIVNLTSSVRLGVYDTNGKLLTNWMAVEFENNPNVYNMFDHVDHFRMY